MYLRPQRLHRRSRQAPSAVAHSREREPRSRNRGGDRPRLQAARRRSRRCCSSGPRASTCRWRPTSSDRPSGCAWRWASSSLDEVAKEIDEMMTPKMPTGMLDAFKMLPMLDRLRDLMPKTVKDAPCQEVVKRDGSLDELPILKTLAGRRRSLHHAAARHHQGSRNRRPEHRHVPHAGVRRPHDRHALAAAQGWRAAPSRRRAAGQAARSGRGA